MINPQPDHPGATVVLTAGVVAGVVTTGRHLLPPLHGFLLGAVPAFLLVALARGIELSRRP